MPITFRKSIRLLPWLSINIGRRSWSISVGPRGAHRTFSSTGQRTTSVDLPGPFGWRKTTTNRSRKGN